VPRREYSRELKLAAMREIDSGKGMAEVARMYQLSPRRLETWKGEWRAKGDLAFPVKVRSRKANSTPIGSRSWNVRSASRQPSGTWASLILFRPPPSA
jgi:transposase-like protein